MQGFTVSIVIIILAKIINKINCFSLLIPEYYEIIKVKFNTDSIEKNDIFYEVSETLIKKQHPLLEEYLKFKLKKYTKIQGAILEETPSAIKRKAELQIKIQGLKELLACH